jgi:hypothetical protein
MTSIKLYVFGALFIAYSAGIFYLGGLKGTAKADTAITAQEAQGEAIAQAGVTALEGQAAHAAAEQVNDNKAEATHAQDDHKIDTATPSSEPLFVQSRAAAKGVCIAAVPGAKAAAGAVGTDPSAGGSVASGGDGSDRRPEIEALKQQLERIAADERLLIAEWPK